MKSAPVILGLAVASAACGKPPDDCETAIGKILSVMQKAAGKAMPADDRKKMVEACRADPKALEDPVTKCALTANDDDAVKACMAPASDGHGKHVKKTEPRRQLGQLAKNSKVYFDINATFVKGTAATLPAQSCCAAPDHHCPITDAWGKDPVWQQLDFQLTEPNLFQYTYRSDDGVTATATAVGDVDCDGKAETYTLHLASQNGSATSQLDGPTP